jgi:hypothetical protein
MPNGLRRLSQLLFVQAWKVSLRQIPVVAVIDADDLVARG